MDMRLKSNAAGALVVSRDQNRQMKECDENATFAVTMDQGFVTNRQTQWRGEER
jgi:hypothetical protein